MDEVKVNVSGDNIAVLEIRKGDALPVKEPVKIAIIGNLEAVVQYLKKNTAKIGVNSLVKVDRDALRVSYMEDPEDYYGAEITGVLTLSKEFTRFGINSGKSWTTFELADMIRLNRSFFTDVNAAAELVTLLRTFKAKVDKEIENSDDKRGNVTLLRRQVVDSNLPGSIKIQVPIFKGLKPETIEVEVDINADDLSCQLVSPMAAEIIQTISNGLIDEQRDEIIELSGLIPIIEV